MTERDYAAMARGLDEAGWVEVHRQAQAGDANCQLLLYWDSRLTEKTRRKWLRRAAEQGHPEACALLGWEDWSELRAAAEAGDPEAQLNLACKLAWLPVPDKAASRHWYLQAALAGVATAAYEMGCFCYEEGNLPEAILWLEHASVGDTWMAEDACKLLAHLYKEDETRAKLWERRALELLGDRA